MAKYFRRCFRIFLSRFFIGSTHSFLSELLHQNKTLLEQLKAKDEEIKQIREMTEAAFGISGTNVFSQKLIDSEKKNRNLNLTLQREKLNNKTLNDQLVETKKHLDQKMKQDQNLINLKANQEKQQWKEKYLTSQKLLAQHQAKLSQAESDKRNVEKILQLEIGNQINVEKFVNDHQQQKGGWKGRAQQICKLKDQLEELRQQQNGSSKQDSPASRHQAHLKQLSTTKYQDLQEDQKQRQLLQIQYQETVAKLEAQSSRRTYLEAELNGLKQKIQILLEKSQNDDKYIQILKKEIKALTYNSKDIVSYLQIEKALFRQIKSIDNDHLQEISQLKLQCKDLTEQICVQAKVIRDFQNQAHQQLYQQPHCTDGPYLKDICNVPGNDVLSINQAKGSIDNSKSLGKGEINAINGKLANNMAKYLDLKENISQ